MPEVSLVDLVEASRALNVEGLLTMVGGVFIASWGMEQMRKFGIHAQVSECRECGSCCSKCI